MSRGLGDVYKRQLQASGLDRAGRRRVAEAVVANHDWTYAIVTEAAAAGHQGFADHWRLVAEPAARARLWCQRHQRDLITAARLAQAEAALITQPDTQDRSRWGSQ